MARVKILNIVEYLQPKLSIAINDAVKQTIPRAFFESTDLYTLFIESLSNQCNTWEEIPDRFIQNP